jgi:ketosteroid isomerase-like protein
MRNLAVLVLIFGLNTWAQEPKVQVPSSPEPGAQMRQEFLRAYNGKDVDAVVRLYSEDATIVSDGGRFSGQDQIRQWIMSGLDQGSRLEIIEPIVEKSSVSLAYGTGRTRRSVGSVIHLGRYLIVMEKIGGEWKIVQHFSLSAGRAPAESAPLSPAPMLRDQLSVERWFVGNWICEGEQHPSPTTVAVKFTDKFTFEMALDGSWLTYHADQMKGPLQGKRTLIGWSTWDANAKLHIRRDMNIGGSRVDVTTRGWDGDKLVFTGYMIANDEKLPIQQTFTKKGDAAYDSVLAVIGAEAQSTEWEEESCRKVADE